MPPAATNTVATQKIEEVKPKQELDRPVSKDVEGITAPQTNIQIDESFGTTHSPFLFSLLTEIRALIDPHGISVVNIEHKNYQEAYFFNVDGEQLRVNVFYNGKERVSNLLAHNPCDASAFLISLLEPLKGKLLAVAGVAEPKSFTFSEPFLEEFHNELLRVVEPFGIVVADLAQQNFCQRYSFSKDGELAVFDMYYNNKKQFKKTVVQHNLSTSVELITEVAALFN